MHDNCSSVIESYFGAMREGFDSTAVADDRCLILTPFSRPDGEMIEIEAQALSDGRLRLSDSGDSIAYLYVNGLYVSRSAREDARKLARRYGVSLDVYELTVEVATPSAAGTRLHALVQAALAVTDMIQKRRPYQRLQFDEVVEAHLVGQRAVYDNEVRIRGQGGLEHVVRFHADSGRRMLIQPLSPANESSAFTWAERWAYRFGDIKAADSAWNTYAVLDDRGDKAGVWSPRTLVPLRQSASVVFWRDTHPLDEALQGALPDR